MEEYINQIEKYLRGQMSKEEEGLFKASLTTDAHMRSFASIMAFIIKEQKSSYRFGTSKFYLYLCT
jgi:hypothetical protein